MGLGECEEDCRNGRCYQLCLSVSFLFFSFLFFSLFSRLCFSGSASWYFSICKVLLSHLLN